MVDGTVWLQDTGMNGTDGFVVFIGVFDSILQVICS
jgi:hypothetical protein